MVLFNTMYDSELLATNFQVYLGRYLVLHNPMVPTPTVPYRVTMFFDIGTKHSKVTLRRNRILSDRDDNDERR